MTRNLKALGLALLAAFALSAVAASAASAQATQDLITLGGAQNTAVVTGTSHNNVFKAGGAEIKCTTSVFTATVFNNAKQATIDATYTGKKDKTPHEPPCETNLGSDATVDMNGCDYLLTGLTDAKHGAESNKHAKVHIKCPVGKEITVTNGLCQLTVPEQTPTEGGIRFTNQAGPPKDVLMDITVTGITYTSTGGFCAFVGVSPEGNNATYTGDVTVKAFIDKGEVSTHVYSEGAQIDLEASS